MLLNAEHWPMVVEVLGQGCTMWIPINKTCIIAINVFGSGVSLVRGMVYNC